MSITVIVTSVDKYWNRGEKFPLATNVSVPEFYEPKTVATKCSTDIAKSRGRTAMNAGYFVVQQLHLDFRTKTSIFGNRLTSLISDPVEEVLFSSFFFCKNPQMYLETFVQGMKKRWLRGWHNRITNDFTLANPQDRHIDTIGPRYAAGNASRIKPATLKPPFAAFPVDSKERAMGATRIEIARDQGLRRLDRPLLSIDDFVYPEHRGKNWIVRDNVRTHEFPGVTFT